MLNTITNSKLKPLIMMNDKCSCFLFPNESPGAGTAEKGTWLRTGGQNRGEEKVPPFSSLNKHTASSCWTSLSSSSLHPSPLLQTVIRQQLCSLAHTLTAIFCCCYATQSSSTAVNNQLALESLVFRPQRVLKKFSRVHKH